MIYATGSIDESLGCLYQWRQFLLRNDAEMRTTLRARWRRVIAAVVFTIGLGGCASEGRFPNGPILLVCPWAAGGGSDRVARQLATLLEQDLGVPVNVVNVTGGDGVTGHSRGALARADGYTMTLITIEIATLHWRQMTSISSRDFAPIALINRDPAAIFVRSDAPWRTARDLEQAIRSAPGALRGSGTATSGIWHLALAGWLTTVGLRPTDVTWVSIAGSAPSMAELLAGGVDLVACSLAEAQALLESGRIRSLGVMATERAPRFPSVPTFAEQGVDFTMGTLRGVALPRDVPEDRARVIADAVRRVATSDAFRTSLSGAGFTPVYEDSAEFAAALQQTDERLGELLRSPSFAGLGSQQIGAMFFPAFLALALAAVVLGLVFTGRNGHNARSVADDEDARNTGPISIWRFVEPLLWIALYLVLAEWAGFILVTSALLLIYLTRLGTRLSVGAAITVVVVPLTYYVFAVVLRVGLPRGFFAW
jgi:tripartite-type tricarboxylate transporter receptor subunit TctC